LGVFNYICNICVVVANTNRNISLLVIFQLAWLHLCMLILVSKVISLRCHSAGDEYKKLPFDTATLAF
jgi:hypothetical protein